MATIEAAQPPTYNERQACFGPAEPPAFVPVSQMLHADLADALTNITGYPGTACDLVSDWRDVSQHPDSYSRAEVIDTGDLLARLVDEIQGLVR